VRDHSSPFCIGNAEAQTALRASKRQNSGRYTSRVLLGYDSDIRDLARLMPDRQIARLLNRCGKDDGTGNSLEGRRGGAKFRKQHEIDGLARWKWTNVAESHWKLRQTSSVPAPGRLCDAPAAAIEGPARLWGAPLGESRLKMWQHSLRKRSTAR